MKDLSTEEGRIEAAKWAGRNLATYHVRSNHTTLAELADETVWSCLAGVGFKRAGTRLFSTPFRDAYRAEFIRLRLEYLRGEIEAERIGTVEIIELQGYADHIDRGDVLLLQWAGVPEHDEDEDEDGYTTAPEFIRIHDEGDGWAIDGATHGGRYTEAIWKFDTLEEAATQVPGFIRYIKELGFTIGE